jgi:hypothetical protein
MAPRSVEPVYVVVKIRSGLPASQCRRRVSSSGAIPLLRMNAMTTSIASVGGLHLGAQLAPEAWFAGGIRQQGGVEYRNEWLVNDVWPPIGPPPKNGVKDRRRVDRVGQRIDLHELTKLFEKRVSDRQSDTDAVVVVDVGEGSLDLTTEMPCEPIGRLRRPQRPLLGWHPIAQLVELGLQPLRYEHLIQTSFQLVHA